MVVARFKDPKIDNRLPLIGKFIQRRRDAKQAAELLKNPFFSTLSRAVSVYWTTDPAPAGQVNEALRHEIGEQLVDEGIAIANSDNPLMENRQRFAAAVAEAARLQVLVMPPEPEPDPSGIRGQFGISGKLRACLLELKDANKDLREWLHVFGEQTTFNDVWALVLTRYWIVLARANVLSALRKPLDDSHPQHALDWYKPFLVSQCARYEHEYRECLGLPSNFSPEPFKAIMKHALFVNCVLQGAKYPDLDWKERCAQIDRGDEV